jgi:imidazolonepropionase-like amidohydrolase
MKMITLWGAEQFGEQATKGSIEEGKTVWSRSDR